MGSLPQCERLKANAARPRQKMPKQLCYTLVWRVVYLQDICQDSCVHFPLGKRGYEQVLPNGILTKSQLQGRGFQGRGNINF